MSDTKPESDSDDIGQVEKSMAFTAIIELVNDTKEAISEDEELDESNFKKLDDNDDIQIAYSTVYKNSKKYEKLYRLAMKKLSKVEIKTENLSTKVDKGNQTIGTLRFENNFLVEKTKMLNTEIFQVRAQLERTSNAKIDEMLSIQKSSSDKTRLEYVASFSTWSSSNSACHYIYIYIYILVPPYDDTKIENNDSIMELEK